MLMTTGIRRNRYFGDITADGAIALGLLSCAQFRCLLFQKQELPKQRLLVSWVISFNYIYLGWLCSKQVHTIQSTAPLTLCSSRLDNHMRPCCNTTAMQTCHEPPLVSICNMLDIISCIPPEDCAPRYTCLMRWSRPDSWGSRTRLTEYVVCNISASLRERCSSACHTNFKSRPNSSQATHAETERDALHLNNLSAWLACNLIVIMAVTMADDGQSQMSVGHVDVLAVLQCTSRLLLAISLLHQKLTFIRKLMKCMRGVSGNPRLIMDS